MRSVLRCDAEDLRARMDRAQARATFELARATSAALASRNERRSSAEGRRRSRLHRGDSRAHRRSFRLDGHIDSEPVFAVLRDGDLIAHEALLQRARVVVALGDTFSGEGGQDIPASLNGPPVAVMLTLIRACDASPAIALGPSPDLGLRLGSGIRQP